MSVDRFDENNKIILENLELIDTETASSSERRIAVLSDLATMLSREGKMLESEERYEAFNSLFKKGLIPNEAAEEAKAYLSVYYSSQLLSDKLTVCKFLSDKLSWRSNFRLASLLGSELDSFEPLAENPKIAYLKNAYADSAFRVFAKILGNPSVTYHGDFSTVCEEVYYGRADMCILPLDSSRDAKLISLCRLVDKYELKIVLVCDVQSSDGSVTTRYALLRKTLTFPKELPLEADARLLEFSFVPDENISLGDVLFAAESFGLKLYKLDAIPLTYSDSEFSYDVILHCPDRSVEPFALFMALAAPQFETLGIYAHLVSKE